MKIRDLLLSTLIILAGIMAGGLNLIYCRGVDRANARPLEQVFSEYTTDHYWHDYWRTISAYAPFGSNTTIQTVRTRHYPRMGGNIGRVGFVAGQGNVFYVYSAFISNTLPGGTASNFKQLTFSGQPGTIIPAGQMVYCDPFSFSFHAYTSYGVTYKGNSGAAGKSAFVKSYTEMGAPCTVTRALDTVHNWEAGGWPAWGALYLEVQKKNQPPGINVLMLGDSKDQGTTVDYPYWFQASDIENVYNGSFSANKSSTEASIITQRIGNGLGYDIAYYAPGSNDLADDDAIATIQQNDLVVIDALKQQGTRVILCTVPPRSDLTAEQESNRIKLNKWRNSLPGGADGVLDIDGILRDPTQPTRLRPEYDSGDGVHPDQDGHDAVFLNLNAINTSFVLQNNLLSDATINLYVSSTSGFNVPGYGLSPATPAKTINGAWEMLPEGKHSNKVVFNIYGGEYYENLNLFGKEYASIVFNGQSTVAWSGNPDTITATSFQKTGAGFTPNAFKGKLVYVSSATNGAGKYNIVLSNTTDTVNYGNLGATPSADAVMRIQSPLTRLNSSGYDYNVWNRLSGTAVDFRNFELYSSTLYAVPTTMADTTTRYYYSKISGVKKAFCNTNGTNGIAVPIGCYITSPCWGSLKPKNSWITTNSGDYVMAGNSPATEIVLTRTTITGGGGAMVGIDLLPGSLRTAGNPSHNVIANVNIGVRGKGGAILHNADAITFTNIGTRKVFANPTSGSYNVDF